MEIENIEIVDYIEGIPPLDSLKEGQLAELVQSMEITFVRKNTKIIQPDQANDYLYLIRTGAVGVTDSQNNL